MTKLRISTESGVDKTKQGQTTDRTPVTGMSGVEETKHGQTDRQTDRTPVNRMSGVEETSMDRQTVRATHRHRFLNFAYPRAEGSLTRNFKRRVSRNAHDKTMHGQTDRQNPGQRNLGCPRADY
jgi:hypothetical protein